MPEKLLSSSENFPQLPPQHSNLLWLISAKSAPSVYSHWYMVRQPIRRISQISETYQIPLSRHKLRPPNLILVLFFHLFFFLLRVRRPPLRFPLLPPCCRLPLLSLPLSNRRCWFQRLDGLIFFATLATSFSGCGDCGAFRRCTVDGIQWSCHTHVVPSAKPR